MRRKFRISLLMHTCQKDTSRYDDNYTLYALLKKRSTMLADVDTLDKDRFVSSLPQVSAGFREIEGAGCSLA